MNRMTKAFVYKSLTFLFQYYVYKISLPVGTRRKRRDGIYVKQPDGTWLREKKKKEKKEIRDIENKKLINNAINHFGTTRDIYEAGYILNDGQMLDFSGKKQGGESGVRYMDHREVEGIPGFKPKKEDQSSSEDMIQFMNEAKAIRIDADNGLVNSIGIPNETQLSLILRNLKNFANGEYVIIEVDNEKGDTIHSIEIDNPRSKQVLDFYNQLRKT